MPGAHRCILPQMNAMRTLLTLTLLFTCLLPHAHAQEDHGGAMDAMVTLHIGGIDDAGWARVNAQVQKERNMNVVY